MKTKAFNIDCMEYMATLPDKAFDLAHLLPRSMYPEYQTEEWNVTLLCRRCHTQFDDNVEFRQKYKHLARYIKDIDELAYNRYYENWR